jgi:hypothetical protein
VTIERYKIGRKYTERHRVSVSLNTPEGAQAIEDGLEAAAAAATVEGRIAPAISWATATLKQAGMPLDYNALVYNEPQWQRENARRSAVWYALKIIEAAHFLRIFVKAGDPQLVAQFALDLAELVTEARFIFGVVVRNAAVGGKEAKNSDKRHVQELQRAEWRHGAAERWQKNPKLSASEVARRIDPARARTIRRVISDLKPAK